MITRDHLETLASAVEKLDDSGAELITAFALQNMTLAKTIRRCMDLPNPDSIGRAMAQLANGLHNDDIEDATCWLYKEKLPAYLLPDAMQSVALCRERVAALVDSLIATTQAPDRKCHYHVTEDGAIVDQFGGVLYDNYHEIDLTAQQAQRLAELHTEYDDMDFDHALWIIEEEEQFAPIKAAHDARIASLLAGARRTYVERWNP